MPSPRTNPIARLPLLAALAALATACTPPPTAGNADVPKKADVGAADDELAVRLWAASKVSTGVGDAHNLTPPEKGMVASAVSARSREVARCFEGVVVKRGCRTNGLAASFDAMLMIQTDGSVRDVRIVPNKNDLAKECHDAIACIQDVLTSVQVQGLQRFEGSRQAYMTVTLRVPLPDELPPPDATP